MEEVDLVGNSTLEPVVYLLTNFPPLSDRTIRRVQANKRDVLVFGNFLSTGDEDDGRVPIPSASKAGFLHADREPTLPASCCRALGRFLG
ncbi:hypothetical protein Tco_0794963 [Tanacetum coccineum]